MVRTVYKGRSILGYLRLNCHNVCPILTKEAKLHFLESTLKLSQTRQKMIFVKPSS